MSYNPKKDGVDHINVYSKGNTLLGRFLSNFTEQPFNHPEDGKFNSVEGYWYWLSSKDDKLRKLSGYEAKKYGREIGAKDWLEDEEFKRKIKLAIKTKINSNETMKKLLKNSDLPLTHYYVYGDKVVDVKEGKWITDYIENLREGKTEVKSNTYDPIIFGKDSTENIINMTSDYDGLHLYFKDGTHKVLDHKPWVLSSHKGPGSVRLKGNQHYKYVTDCDSDRYEMILQNRPRGVWFPRSIEEGFMLRSGYTLFKGMKLEELSILSFDIEAPGLNPHAEDACVPLLAITFRNRKGEYTKKQFDIFEYESYEDMWEDINDIVQELDPDVITGHNIFAYDLVYSDVNSPVGLSWGKDGSLIKFNEKASKFRKDGSQQYEFYNAIINGRTIIDTLFLSIKYDIGRDFPSYGLKAIEQHLGLVEDDRSWDFKTWPVGRLMEERKKETEIGIKKWNEFKQYCMDDSDSPIKMIDIMLPPFFYLCQSVPKTLQQMINEASGSQLDSLMIRSYLQEGQSQPMTSQKAEFEGAISMGVPGIYENVRKVDVASLYPSIMLQYEIYDKEKDPNKNMLYMLKYFRDERLKNKKLTKDTGDKYFDDMQAAQKIMINSMYGFLGAGFLLYNFPKGASEVTRHGREILLKGVEWATGHTLKKVIKQIRNKGKENEEIRYEWIVGDKVDNPSGHSFELVNVDTDSFSITNGLRPTSDEFNNQIEELNSIYPELIVWEDDGIFDKVIVVKAKNYVLKTGDKIKYKGSSITDQKKEPMLIGFLHEVIDHLIEGTQDCIPKAYKAFCQHALKPDNIKQWCVKKTITSAVLNPARLNEEKVLDACNEAIKAGVIGKIQEGDKVYLYQAIDGEVQKVTKGEKVFLKDGTPKMVENKVLRFPELYNNDMDKWHYVQRVYNTLKILENVVNMDDIEKYHLKSKRNLLEK